MIDLYQRQNSPVQLAALALMALVLGAVRTLAIIYSPMERRMIRRIHQSKARVGEGTKEAMKLELPLVKDPFPVH